MSSEVRNVLVVGPGVHDVTDELCTRLLTDVRPAETVIGVTIVQTPADRRHRWQKHDTIEETTTAFVDVESTTRAASADTQADVPDVTSPIESVADPTDLPAIKAAITAQLSAAEGRPSVCFHSVTDLLSYVETERALEFLYTLSEAVSTADSTAHYHLDGQAHDEETIELFGTVTDRVIELSQDGSDVSIR